MTLDNESWLVEIGDDIIVKKSEVGFESLTEIERAIYCLWVIDYAIRNSGSLEPVKDVFPQSIQLLNKIAVQNNWAVTAEFFAQNKTDEAICAAYYDQFESICGELRARYGEH